MEFNRDKQIDEMAKDIACLTAWDEDEIPTINCLETAKRLYLKGYRKASDVAEEIFAELQGLLLMRIGVNQAIAELKKKYTVTGTNVGCKDTEG